MNSYLFLDRVPSELRGGARIRLLSSLERWLAGTGTRHFRRSFLVFPSRALRGPSKLLALLFRFNPILAET